MDNRNMDNGNMDNRKTQIILIGLMSLLLFGMAFYSWVKPADAFSYSERRNLSQRPALSLESLLAGGDRSFMTQFESYATDQFPFREAYRRVCSVTSLYVLGKKEMNGVYLAGKHAVKVEYPLDTESLDWDLVRMEDVRQRYLGDNRVFVCAIPDKNYFMAKDTGHPALDYEELFARMREGTGSYAEYVDITDQLAIGDYYYTDAHWKQENLKEIAGFLCRQMGSRAYEEYETVTLESPFYGVYYGQAALPLEPDKLSYLTNETLEQLRITCLDSGQPEEIPLYDLEKAAGRDGYELFLSGSKALITMENPKSDNDRELIIFRDSFASSLAPLLTAGYRKVTLVDIRYISPAYLGNFVDFEGADILFLYSATLLNDGRNQLMK